MELESKSAEERSLEAYPDLEMSGKTRIRVTQRHHGKGIWVEYQDGSNHFMSGLDMEQTKELAKQLNTIIGEAS